MVVKGFRGNNVSTVDNGAIRIPFPFEDLRGDVIITMITGNELYVCPCDAFDGFINSVDVASAYRAQF
jgi:hypothetical protein